MASLFGALDTAVSGLTAQSVAFGNISDNIANSQSTGFKGTDTTFADYLSTSNAVTNDSGAVIARPEYENEVQGTIATSTNPLALAIDGQGFFQVSQQSGTGTTATLSTTPEYSRDGDFSLDSQGYLVNGSQQVLDGWLADPTTGVVNQAQQVPIQINQAPIAPTPTANITLAANLPATPTPAATASTPATVSSQVQVFDTKGTEHDLTLTYTQATAGSDTWNLAITASAADGGATLGSATLEFGPTASSNPTVPAGTIGSVTDGTSAATTYVAGTTTPATVSIAAAFGGVTQPITLNLGTLGAPSGLTQYAGTTYAPTSLSQDGLAPGNYSGVTTQSNGNVVVTYDNGQSKVVAQVPVVQFANADALQRQNGQGFTATVDSGTANVKDISTSGATMVAGSVESSNVDIATQFTKLIVSQQAYAANAKVITTANELLQTTIDIKR